MVKRKRNGLRHTSRKPTNRDATMSATSGRGATRRRGGGKPHAYKRRQGGGGSGSGKYGDVIANVGADWRDRRRYSRPRGTGGNRPYRGAHGRRHENYRRHEAFSEKGGAGASRRWIKGGEAPAAGGLRPIKVRSGGIMCTWKKPLGGLIRYYIHTRTSDRYSPVDQRTAEEEVDRMYYRSGCSMEDTKTMILSSLGATKDILDKGCIGLSIAIEKDGGTGGIPIPEDANSGTIDGGGIKLRHVLRAGEGPAHSHERWTIAVVPQWAMGRSYFLEVENRSPLNLSCEVFLDGEKVAFNAPLDAQSTRTIRPDTVRYFQRHRWILDGARKVKLSATARGEVPEDGGGARYNGIRPDHAGRVDIMLYPDPASFGWRFTGSVHESRVEFYEKRMNDGGVVKMDFYYTTGTIKTVLHHPSSGTNQLFRAQVTPDQFIKIMKNPRAHTGQGYRRKEDRPTENSANSRQEEGVIFDEALSGENQVENEAEMEDACPSEVSSVPATYYAKDDSYDFKRQGHRNRQDEMSKLQQSDGYTEWKEANNKEYAVIHAKFYVSIPKRMYGAPPKLTRGGWRGGRSKEPLPVPEQSAIIDVKAAEAATLGTRYEVTGPAQRMAGRSRVRMERINGLAEGREWRGDPVFEKKIYYRAEDIVDGREFGDGSGDAMNEEDDDDDDGDNAPRNLPLDEYKAEKIDQVRQYDAELGMTVRDPEETEQRLRNVRNKICLSESMEDVDDIIKLFYDDLIHRQITNICI